MISDDEKLVERVARALAYHYSRGWKDRGPAGVLTAEEWAGANWEPFCGAAVEALNVPEAKGDVAGQA